MKNLEDICQKVLGYVSLLSWTAEGCAFLTEHYNYMPDLFVGSVVITTAYSLFDAGAFHKQTKDDRERYLSSKKYVNDQLTDWEALNESKEQGANPYKANIEIDRIKKRLEFGFGKRIIDHNYDIKDKYNSLRREELKGFEVY